MSPVAPKPVQLSRPLAIQRRSRKRAWWLEREPVGAKWDPIRKVWIAEPFGAIQNPSPFS